MPDDDERDAGTDSDDSDRKSKMSFSYWGADKVTLQKPAAATKPAAAAKPAAPRAKPGAAPQTAAYGRESSANAKFGTRLVGDAPMPAPGPAVAAAMRTASRRTGAVAAPGPNRRPAQSEDGHNVRSTAARPPWNGRSATPSGGGAPAAAAAPKSSGAVRARNTSQPNAAVRSTSTSTKPALASPAPSEDSGVGLYRQMMAKDPSMREL
jgi:hypothetical protein